MSEHKQGAVPAKTGSVFVVFIQENTAGPVSDDLFNSLYECDLNNKVSFSRGGSAPPQDGGPVTPGWIKMQLHNV